MDPESINGLNLYAYCGNDPINKYDPTGHIAIPIIIFLVGLVGAYIGVSVERANNTSNNFGISGWEKFLYSLSGIFVGDLLVSLNNWDKIEQTIVMDPKNEYNFKFDQNPFYSFWNAILYAIYLKNHQYKNEDSRTTLGLYLELQAHYIFYLIGNEHGTNGAHMGPTDEDPTGKLFEFVASTLTGGILQALQTIY